MKSMNELKDAVICDIDGTLSNLEHRLQYLPIKDNPLPDKSWKKFYAGISEDTVIEPTREILDMVLMYGYDIIMLTGRDEAHREATVDWLHFHDISYEALFMRPDGNRKPDSDVKRDIYIDRIHGEYNIKFVLEDRKRVVDMWRGLGLHCLQHCDGNY